MPKSETYWKNRANQRFAESEKYSEAQINRIWGIYNEAQKDLQKMINEIYSSYAGQSGLDREMMERIINSADLKQLISQVKKESGKDITEQVMRNYKGRINRLQALQLRLQAKAEQLTNKVENAATATLKSVTEQSYRRTMYDIGKAENFNSASFATLDDRTIDKMLKTKWVANGNYSQRIWKNENQLVNKLDSLLTRGAMTGMSYERMSMELRQSFQTEKYKADRLIRTEMAYFHNEAEKECYEDLGIDQYIYIATLDDRTSEVCRDLDGKVFKTKDGQAGKNMPPMHPNCRSTTGPYYDDDNISEWKRRARKEDGENDVIKYQTYRQWEKASLLVKNKENILDFYNHKDADMSGTSKEDQKAIKKAKRPEEILNIFNSNDHTLLDKSFRYLDFEEQKEAAYGIIYMRDKYGIDLSKLTIRASDIKNLGEYRSDRKSITLRETLKPGQTFVTIVHELTHALEDQKNIDVEYIIDTAIKNVGLNHIKAENVKIIVAGNAYDLNTEVFAYSMEKYAVNAWNKTTKKFIIEVNRLTKEALNK